jgi:hypothetical protein
VEFFFKQGILVVAFFGGGCGTWVRTRRFAALMCVLLAAHVTSEITTDAVLNLRASSSIVRKLATAVFGLQVYRQVNMTLRSVERKNVVIHFCDMLAHQTERNESNLTGHTTMQKTRPNQ